MKNRILSILVLALILCACQKEIPFKGGDKTELLVIEAVGYEGELITANIDHTTYFLSSKKDIGFHSLLKVSLKDLSTGVSYAPDSLSTANYLYYFPIKADPNKQYQLTASHPNFPTATVSSAISSNPEIISYTINDRYAFGASNSGFEQSDSILDVTIQVKDPLGLNGINIRAVGTREVYVNNSGFKSTDTIKNSKASMLLRKTLLEVASIESFFSNNFPILPGDLQSQVFLINESKLDGQILEFNVLLSIGRYYFVPSSNYEVKERYLNLDLLIGQTSPSLLKYLFSAAQNASGGNEFFVEPTSIINDAQGGIGVFGVFSRVKIPLI